jgi:tRNA pseudouridine55 synthase
MPRKQQPAPFDGALVIDKPQGKTSHDVVDAVRHLAGFRQVGHLGTLDPLATGVLVVLLGKATRFVQFYSGRRKRYTAGFRFGFATDTYDSEGQAQGPDNPPLLDKSVLEKLANERVGIFSQMPPIFSAKKIHGRPAYELARKNEPVELKAVEVEVFEFRLTGIEGSIARFVIECSSGTYIRSLAHEMGEKLGCGAHLTEISRTAVGEFSLEQALKLEELAEAARNNKFESCVIKLEHLLPNFPSVTVLPVVEKRVRHGSKFTIMLSQLQPGRSEPPPGATAQLDGGEPRAPKLRVFNQQQKLIAVAQAVVPRTYQPIVVFDPLP